MEEEAQRDRISELPEEIKEQIVSFLCMKDAVCTSSLSSVWRYSWVSLPFLDFGYYFYLKFTSFFSTQICCVRYLQMLDEFLQVYIKKNPSFRGLKKMSLYVPMLSDLKMRDYGANVVYQYLSLAKHNVDELIYWVIWFDNALQNCLPILDSNTLTKLELHGFYLATEKKVAVQIDLPKLKHLSLITFNVDESMLETLLARCRALEKLEFSYCRGIKVLRVSRVSKLKELEVKHIHDLDLVEIDALEIQCLSLLNLQCKLKMASNSCNNLVNLFVHHCGITDDFFNNVAEFPKLKTISLIDCPELKHIKIISNSLTSFEVKDCPNLSQTELETPKLLVHPILQNVDATFDDKVHWPFFIK